VSSKFNKKSEQRKYDKTPQKKQDRVCFDLLELQFLTRTEASKNRNKKFKNKNN